MTMKNLGSRFLALIAAAMFVAACSTDGADDDDSVIQEPVQEEYTPPPVDDIDDEPLYDVGSMEHLMTVVGTDRVYFAYDSSDLDSDARTTLGLLAEWLLESGRSLQMQGHCDERGTREYNLALGERRANAAKDYLVALGVPAGQVDTISYGKERPASTVPGESGWSQNCRGQFGLN